MLFWPLSFFITVNVSDDNFLSVFLNNSLLEECSVDIHKDVHQEHNAGDVKTCYEGGWEINYVTFSIL